MMRMRTKLSAFSPPMGGNSPNGGVDGGGGGVGGEGGDENWEVRPSGMLVQKRIDVDQVNVKPPPTIRVRVKFGSIYHEIYINSQATFGELKKKLTGPTGLHHEDQKVFYKDKERNSKDFLDMVGVKDKSKLVVFEDPISQEKRYIEMKKTAKMEKAAKSISEISLTVDKLAAQVSDLESVILRGGRVAEIDIVSLIELLMNELIKLDGIVADGDVKLQRKMQVMRVQKYVETLDMLKVKNSMPAANVVHKPNGNHQNTPNGHAKHSVLAGNGPNGGKPPLAVKQQPKQQPKQQQRHSIGHSPLRPQPQRQEQTRHSTSATVVTTQWETFESAPPLIALSPTRLPESVPQKPEKPKFPWDFD